jgi:hypothetical protein
MIAVAGLWLATAAATGATAAEPPRGLVLHYSFDQPAASGLVVDRSGLDNNGRASGVQFIAAGKKEGGCELSPDGTIQVAGSPSASVKQATFALWLKTSRSDTTRQCILGVRSGQGYALEILGGAPAERSRGRLAFSLGGKSCLSDLAVTDGNWHHVAAAFDGNLLRMYVDGQPQNQVTLCRTEVAALLNDLAIGAGRSGPPAKEKAQGLGGVLDELMIFNRALSMEEIRGLVSAVDASSLKPRFTRQQVAARLRELRMLYEEGLLTEDFYARKVAECEAGK